MWVDSLGVWTEAFGSEASRYPIMRARCPLFRDRSELVAHLVTGPSEYRWTLRSGSPSRRFSRWLRPLPRPRSGPPARWWRQTGQRMLPSRPGRRPPTPSLGVPVQRQDSRLRRREPQGRPGRHDDAGEEGLVGCRRACESRGLRIATSDFPSSVTHPVRAAYLRETNRPIWPPEAPGIFRTVMPRDRR